MVKFYRIVWGKIFTLEGKEFSLEGKKISPDSKIFTLEVFPYHIQSSYRRFVHPRHPPGRRRDRLAHFRRF